MTTTTTVTTTTVPMLIVRWINIKTNKTVFTSRQPLNDPKCAIDVHDERKGTHRVLLEWWDDYKAAGIETRRGDAWQPEPSPTV